MVDKLKQFKKEANHKLRILRQKLGRQSSERPTEVFDLSEMEVEEDILVKDIMKELALLKLNVSAEDEWFRRLVRGAGQGRPKTAEFEFACRTILATGLPVPNPDMATPLPFNRALTSNLPPSGCSARAARDQMLVAGQLFLSECKFRLIIQLHPNFIAAPEWQSPGRVVT